MARFRPLSPLKIAVITGREREYVHSMLVQEERPILSSEVDNRWRATVFILGPQKIFNEGLETIFLQKKIGTRGVGFEMGELVGEKIHSSRADTVLVDVSLPDFNLDNLFMMSHKAPDAKMILLGRAFSKKQIELFKKLGVRGFVLQSDGQGALEDAVMTVKGGHLYESPATTEQRSALSKSFIEALTPREIEVLQLLIQGYTNQEAADKLMISVKTAETHRAHIIGKTGAKTRAELARIGFVLT